MAESHHRKIELQSPEDLQYLIANARRAAAERLDLDLPRAGDPNGEDQYRARVEKLVYEYINTTFNLIAQNITISGLPPTSLPDQPLLPTSLDTSPSKTQPTEIEVYEPIDAALLARARALYRQEEELRVEIAALRRSAPRRAAETLAAEFTSSTGGGSLDVGGEEEKKEADDARIEVEVDLGMAKLPRQEQIEKDWHRAVAGLAKLQAEMPATAALMQRAKAAGDFALTEE